MRVLELRAIPVRPDSTDRPARVPSRSFVAVKGKAQAKPTRRSLQTGAQPSKSFQASSAAVYGSAAPNLAAAVNTFIFLGPITAMVQSRRQPPPSRPPTRFFRQPQHHHCSAPGDAANALQGGICLRLVWQQSRFQLAQAYRIQPKLHPMDVSIASTEGLDHLPYCRNTCLKHVFQVLSWLASGVGGDSAGSFSRWHGLYD